MLEKIRDVVIYNVVVVKKMKSHVLKIVNTMSTDVEVTEKVISFINVQE